MHQILCKQCIDLDSSSIQHWWNDCFVFWGYICHEMMHTLLIGMSYAMWNKFHGEGCSFLFHMRISRRKLSQVQLACRPETTVHQQVLEAVLTNIHLKHHHINCHWIRSLIIWWILSAEYLAPVIVDISYCCWIEWCNTATSINHIVGSINITHMT